MEERRKDARREPVIVDLEALVPEDHLLRKIERVMDYEWLYALLSPYYCHDNGRPGIDPVVLIKMVLIQHLFGIASLRQTYREIQVNVAPLVPWIWAAGADPALRNGELRLLQALPG